MTYATTSGLMYLSVWRENNAVSYTDRWTHRDVILCRKQLSYIGRYVLTFTSQYDIL
jgi:hypothetical protein